MSLQDSDSKCKTCREIYTDVGEKWCTPCQINSLEPTLTEKSGREKIDKFIEEMQLKIGKSQDILFEWIPYNQFDRIIEVCKCCFATNYSATWKDGPLSYDKDKNEYKRTQDKHLFLKRLDNQNINEFLDKVC